MGAQKDASRSMLGAIILGLMVFGILGSGKENPEILSGSSSIRQDNNVSAGEP